MTEESKGPTQTQIDKAIRLLPFYESSVIPKRKILEVLGYNDLIKDKE